MPSTATITTRRISQARAEALCAPLSRPGLTAASLIYPGIHYPPPPLRCTCRRTTQLFNNNTAPKAIHDHFLDQPDLRVFHPSDFSAGSSSSTTAAQPPTRPVANTCTSNARSSRPRCTCRSMRRMFSEDTTTQALADHFQDQPDLRVIHPIHFGSL
ncbi:hypothetical protein M408DRAFT_328075 [Serendipita vermifera MAFF 305830]|uniref:Uncharacterized protein n=1 Tax=Serendipita vermifera MAFF 305830 TaxID=933852 RepID=A0A0C2WWI7_SERVB|nr:hypothetical protein M408DRAFT_328075 [Serendipita vermifera MAFF 305830]